MKNKNIEYDIITAFGLMKMTTLSLILSCYYKNKEEIQDLSQFVASSLSAFYSSDNSGVIVLEKVISEKVISEVIGKIESLSFELKEYQSNNKT